MDRETVGIAVEELVSASEVLQMMVGVFADSLDDAADVAAETGRDDSARRMRVAAGMLKGVDADRDLVTYLKALSWTLEQAAIELDDATEGGDGWKRREKGPG